MVNCTLMHQTDTLFENYHQRNCTIRQVLFSVSLTYPDEESILCVSMRHSFIAWGQFSHPNSFSHPILQRDEYHETKYSATADDRNKTDRCNLCRCTQDILKVDFHTCPKCTRLSFVLHEKFPVVLLYFLTGDTLQQHKMMLFIIQQRGDRWGKIWMYTDICILIRWTGIFTI